MSPLLDVSPRIALVDEKITVKAHKLKPHQKVTIYAKLSNGRRDTFESFGHYIANRKGEINLENDVSSGGSYLGVDSMGLFWSMRPTPGQKKGLRFMVKDVEKPMEVNITLTNGHVEPTYSILSNPENPKTKNEETGQSLAVTIVQRTYLAENVERIVIAFGRLRGVLFIPTDGGCYPGVIDLFGSVGGLVEYRAALLASHGFACLALAYFDYEDLPEYLCDVEVEYFLEAVEWLSEHTKVLPGGIGVIGTSFGGQIAFQMASYSTSITASVSVSGPSVILNPSISYKGEYLTAIPIDSENAYECGNAVIWKDAYNMVSENHWDCLIPVENAQGKLMMICGEDDRSLPAKEMAFELKNRLRDLDCGSKLTILTYPKTGHLIEPPYMPLCEVSFNKTQGCQQFWGGSPAEHNAAQCHSWNAVLDFFRQNIKNVKKSKL